MSCSVDSGLCVVLIILSVLLAAVGVLLFYDFENVCENTVKNNLTNMVRKLQAISFALKMRLSVNKQQQ